MNDVSLEPEYDVVVVGAGVSGVPAAVASARSGAKTLLLEQTEALGGTMTASLGFPLCGLFENDTSRSPQLLNEGLSEEFFSAISQVEKKPVVAMGRVYVCLCSVDLFSTIYTQWIAETNLTVRFGIHEFSVVVQDQQIEIIQFRTQEGQIHDCAVGQVIDCSGSGAVIAQSGADQICPKQLPLAGFSVRLQQVGEEDLLPLKVPYVLRKAVEEGSLPSNCSFTQFSDLGAGEALCKFSFPEKTTPNEAKQITREALGLLQKQLPAMRDATVTAFSPQILSREGVRLQGRYLLSKEDVLRGEHFDDGVVRGAWPMEVWDPEKGVQYTYVENEGVYEIPLRSFQSRDIKNLWAAGRLLSADSAALASARVMGTALAIGEAAGIAAAKEYL